MHQSRWDSQDYSSWHLLFLIILTVMIQRSTFSLKRRLCFPSSRTLQCASGIKYRIVSSYRRPTMGTGQLAAALQCMTCVFFKKNLQWATAPQGVVALQVLFKKGLLNCFITKGCPAVLNDQWLTTVKRMTTSPETKLWGLLPGQRSPASYIKRMRTEETWQWYQGVTPSVSSVVGIVRELCQAIRRCWLHE